MQIEQFGDGKDLLFVLGWGNRIHHDAVHWLVDRFVEDGYRVHTVELPLVVSDYEAELIDPVADYAGDLDNYRLVGHSTGGLVGAFLDGSVTETYLSPWWGFPQSQQGLILSLLTSIPISRPIVPSGIGSRAVLGELASDEQLTDSPDKAAPTFLREARRAQRSRPPIDDAATVFCTLSDRIVGTRAIGDAVSAEQIFLYDGGHELFSSSDRDQYVEPLLAAVDDGADAITTIVSSHPT